MNAPVRLVPADSVSSLFSVSGLRCAGCIAKLEKGLADTPGVLTARVNFTTKRVEIHHDPALDDDQLCDIISKIGFTAHPFLGEKDGEAKRESRELLKCLGVAAFAAMNVMLLSVAVWSGADGAQRDFFHWVSALIALPAIAYAGRPFFKSAWSALKHGRTNMDVPISIGVLLATAISLHETIIGGPHAYFDGATSLLFFLLAGRVLDSIMRARAQDSVAALLRQTAPGGMIIRTDGQTEWRLASEMRAGDHMLVAAGDRLAADGVVMTGDSNVDRALVTGESAPEAASPGTKVLAGTINLDAPLEVKITAVGDDTVISGIARLMEAASGHKSRYIRIADRAARLYAPAVHLLALLSFIGWLLMGVGLHQATLIAIAVLIITCPCALGLAVPVAQVVASGSLMRRGVLIKDGSALERLAEADRVLFDKTGTLTLGRPVPDGPLPLDPAEKPVALALSRASRHPLSRAITVQLESEGIVPAHIDAMEEQSGLGMEGLVDGRRVRLGRPDWVGITDDNGSSLATGFAMEQPKLLRFTDALRPGAVEAVVRLQTQGLEPLMLSGDRLAAAGAIAGRLSMDFRAELSPSDKYALIEKLQKQGHKVLMVGDGLNDGPALKAAHVSMAPASASDVGQAAADLIFLGDPLEPVPVAVAAARRTMRVIRQNIMLAVGYNIIAVPLGVLGYVTPLVAAIAMSGSSIIVVSNALRLRNAAR
ncbi:MAG: heavy metal translocating P-type ATPase [Sphingomonadaceae bacterium]